VTAETLSSLVVRGVAGAGKKTLFPAVFSTLGLRESPETARHMKRYGGRTMNEAKPDIQVAKLGDLLWLPRGVRRPSTEGHAQPNEPEADWRPNRQQRRAMAHGRRGRRHYLAPSIKGRKR